MTNKPVINVTSYFSPVDGVCVVHIDTPEITEDGKGPLIRIYLNDYPIEESPPFPGTSEVPAPNVHQDIERLLSQFKVSGTVYHNEWDRLTRELGYIPPENWQEALNLLEDLQEAVV